MATLVVTIVTPDTDAFLVDQLLLDGSSPYTITQSSNAQDRVARYIDGVAAGAFGMTSFTVAVS